jgi:hypothetical protein
MFEFATERGQSILQGGGMKDRLSLAAFFLASAFAAFLYGFFAHAKWLPPAALVISTYETIENLVLNWRNDFGFEPTRLLVQIDGTARSGQVNFENPDATASSRPVVVAHPGAAPGNRFISGLTYGRSTLMGALLLDQAGEVIHFWPINFEKISENGESPNNVYLHGIEPLRDGSIVVNFDNGDFLARIDPCGEIVWKSPGRFHHSATVSYDGTIWSWANPEVPVEAKGNVQPEFLVQVDSGTGRRLDEISLENDIIASSRNFGSLALHTWESDDEVVYCCDAFHPNDAETLPPDLAPAFPMFAVGDVLISLRSLNMIAVLDPKSHEIKWSQIGPWHRQHDPDFLPNGTISVLDNNMARGASRIIAIDPSSNETKIVFDGAKRNNFYTWRRGRHQTLPNGNIVLVESEKGRVIEANPAGDIVWRYENVFDAERNGLVNDALVLPIDFFSEGALNCPAS